MLSSFPLLILFIISTRSTSYSPCIFSSQYLQVNSRDKQSEMRSSRSLGDLKGSLLKGNERVRKHSTGEVERKSTQRNLKKSLAINQSERHYCSIRSHSERATKSCWCQVSCPPAKASRVACQRQFTAEWCHSHWNVNGKMRLVLCQRGKMQIGGESDNCNSHRDVRLKQGQVSALIPSSSLSAS